MDDIERAALARTWWQALAAGGTVPTIVGAGPQLLSGLVDQLSAALDADPFDANAGTRVGAALWAAHLTDQAVPMLSAPVLHVLAERSDRPDAGRRLAGLLTTLGQGHQRRVDEADIARRFAPAENDRDHDARFRVLFDNTAVAIAIGDTDGVLVEANPALADMIGVPLEQLRGISVYDFAHADDRDNIRTLLYEKLVPAREGTVTLDQRLVRADGSIGWMTFAITYVEGSHDRPDCLLAIGVDVTERHVLQEELHRQARHDPLTGLPNRRYLLERIEQLIADADGDNDRAGLCFADLDHFKHVNDHYGHRVGDRVLSVVANRLYDAVHGRGCFVCRLGGDEFVALIAPPTDGDSVSVLADYLLAAFAEPIVIDGTRIEISASIGAVVTSLAHADAESLLDAADTGLRNAKRNSKGNWVMHTMPRFD
ncbi:sensor domain-containing diguanylate cyclase [Nocardia sp. NPDC005366]|uniref:sensor domain-containing diguanylate cyclase n=1 Tax=Nocardia sp. NPDC005366 TaxID=3156878 RepID=UPI00339E317B